MKTTLEFVTCGQFYLFNDLYEPIHKKEFSNSYCCY